MKNGKVSRGRLGILMQQLTPELAKSFNLKEAKGALIAQIEKDGPADKAGLRDGDIVIEYNGKPIADIRELSQAVASTKPGAKVKVKAMREGKPVSLVIVVGEMPTDGKLNFKKPAASQNNALGANVRPLNDKEKKRVSTDCLSSLSMEQPLKPECAEVTSSSVPAVRRSAPKKT